MGEPIFLKHTDGLAFEEIAGLVGVSLPAGVPAARRIVDVAPLDRAGPAHLTFYDDGSHAQAAASTHAGLCLTNAARAKDLPATVPALVVAEPYQAFLTVACRLFPQAVRPSSLYPPGPSALAHIDPSARLEDGVTVEPGAVIGPRAEIGAGTTIGANAVIGADVRITSSVCSARACARFTSTSPPSTPSVATCTVNACVAPGASAGPTTRTAVASAVNVVDQPTVLPAGAPAAPFDGSAGSSDSVAGSAVV